MILKKKIAAKVELLKKRFPKLSKKYLLFFSLLLGLIIIFYFTKNLFIAALVNGKPISRIALIRNLEKQAGQQTLDNLVTKELILQEAEKRGIKARDEDVQKEIERIRAVVEEEGSTLEAALAYQGQTLADLKETLVLKITVERILGDQVQVSDDEVSKYYDENKSIFGTKKLEEVKDQIKEQLFQEKLGTKFQEWIVEVKNNANIKYLVSF